MGISIFTKFLFLSLRQFERQRIVLHGLGDNCQDKLLALTSQNKKTDQSEKVGRKKNFILRFKVNFFDTASENFGISEWFAPC
jgi:hypothetical protein